MPQDPPDVARAARAYLDSALDVRAVKVDAATSPPTAEQYAAWLGLPLPEVQGR